MKGNSEKFWKDFEQYLLVNLSKKTREDKMIYSKRYAHILQTGDASELLGMATEKRRHAMKSIATLAKFGGCYDYWREIQKKYQLTWAGENDDVAVFNRIMGGRGENFTEMVKWVKTAVEKLPTAYGNVLLFGTMTGLRPSEVMTSLSLVHNELSNYLNPERQMLEHFKYKVFLRKTKKAYVSLVTNRLLDAAQKSGDFTYPQLQSVVVDRGIPMRFKDCRKIFATHMRKRGIASELVDLLQGRVPRTVFTRHYFRPDVDFNEMRAGVDSILELL